MKGNNLHLIDKINSFWIKNGLHTQDHNDTPLSICL